MNKKNVIITIISCFFVLVILLTVISTTVIKVESGMKIENPVSINIWHNQTDPAIITKENYANEYNSIMTAYNQMSSFSLFECVLNNFSQDSSEVYQDLSGNHKLWNNDEKKKDNKIVIEFIYSEIQELVVNYDGNKKIARYQYLIFAIDNETRINEVSIYFATTSTGTFNQDENTKAYPFVIHAKASVLYNAVKKVMNF